MAKRRNRAKQDRQISLRVVTPGFLIKVAGHRTAEGSKMVPAAGAKPVHVGRVYTGINKGKSYPYSSQKRGGVGPLTIDIGSKKP